MTTPQRRIGDAGERLAADYLERHGHRVIDRNVRRREGEIDLVTIEGDTVVFVEVKLRRPREFGRAVEALTAAKRRRLQTLAEAYAAEHPELPQAQRIDLVAVELGADGSVREVRHVESAVEG
ncbi:MAG: YraN family protein [Dehalococcoidia bacterium]